MGRREEVRVGLDALAHGTALLQRIRRAHPTAGLYEAADLQWWWADAAPSTDRLARRFWTDDDGRPEAAVIVTDWGDHVALDPIVLPDAPPDRMAEVLARGIADADEAGFADVGLEVDRDDAVLPTVLVDHGFALEDGGLAETWLVASARPPVSPLPAGYRLSSRRDTPSRPHHMDGPRRRHTDVGARLRQTSLYRPDLDLVVHDPAGGIAAYGLCWFDPASGTGLVEPMRTDEAHRRRGLARHVLTTGIDRLAAAGATRIKICFELDNAAARDLYLGVGFEPTRQTVVYGRHRTPPGG